jgi:glucose/mannose-6-phosphate isomerase
VAGTIDLGPARVAELDTGDMLGAIGGLPRQLREGYDAARARLAAGSPGAGALLQTAGPRAVVVCGMGGSAIGADLVLACLPDLPVPAVVVRGYGLPAWAGSDTLVVVVSYSGGTEESLACAAQALSRGCVPVCVASGGRLAAFAEAEGLPLMLVPGGGQPRASVGHLSMPLLATLEAAGLCSDSADAVALAVDQLEADAVRLAPGSGDEFNRAKTLARRLHGRTAVVYGAGATTPAARRWKGQINENAKAPAFFNELPELDHNEIMGWTSLPQATESTIALFLDDAGGDPRLARRAELTALEYEALGVITERVTARGPSCLARLFSLVHLGDYVSFYLALLYGVDPSPVDAIEHLKARLAGVAAAG